MPETGNRNAPAGNRSASKIQGRESNPSIPETVDDVEPAGLVDGVHVVILHSRTATGGHRWTRRPYLSLKSAQKALDRAAMRGDSAYLVLCQLHAVDTRLGGAL